MPNDEIAAWIEKTPAGQQPTLAALRKLVMALGQDVTEEIKWGRPCYSTSRGLCCYLQSTKKHAALGFQQGATLNDPEKLLEGTGKDMRHIKFRDGENFDRAAVAALLKQAASQ
jgi:hypothetical protein